LSQEKDHNQDEYKEAAPVCMCATSWDFTSRASLMFVLSLGDASHV
jgi:hypothetical protein